MSQKQQPTLIITSASVDRDLFVPLSQPGDSANEILQRRVAAVLLNRCSVIFLTGPSQRVILGFCFVSRNSMTGNCRHQLCLTVIPTTIERIIKSGALET